MLTQLLIIIRSLTKLYFSIISVSQELVLWDIASSPTSILVQSDSCLCTPDTFFHQLDIASYLVHGKKYRTCCFFLSFGFLHWLFFVLVATLFTCSGLKAKDCCVAFSISLQMSMHLAIPTLSPFAILLCLGFHISKTIWYHAVVETISFYQHPQWSYKSFHVFKLFSFHHVKHKMFISEISFTYCIPVESL